MSTLTLEHRVAVAKSDNVERNALIEEFRPFIMNAARKKSGRYLRYGEDDELSIALMAFDEAIISYEADKGSFLTFAKVVIWRRLTDYYRTQTRYSFEVSQESLMENDDEDVRINPIDEVAAKRYEQEQQQRDIVYEIEIFKTELAKWGMSITDLVAASPSHKALREESRQIVRFILSNDDARSYVDQKKMLPINLIEKNLKLPRKKLERLRRYIIAMYVVATGDMPGITEYLGL